MCQQTRIRTERGAVLQRELDHPLRARVALAIAFSTLLCSPAAADSSLRLAAGVSAHGQGDSLDSPGFTLGGALTPLRWAPGARFALAPQLELGFARRDVGPLSIDVIELPLLLRGELIFAGRSFHALGGVHGSVVLRALRSGADGLSDDTAALKRADLGWLAGAGFELAALAGGRLFVELRYQRGARALLAGDDATRDSPPATRACGQNRKPSLSFSATSSAPAGRVPWRQAPDP